MNENKCRESEMLKAAIIMLFEQLTYEEQKQIVELIKSGSAENQDTK